jgi:mono/diheme cytochrome c family protein
MFLTVTFVSAHGTGKKMGKNEMHEMKSPEQYRDKTNPYWSDINSIVAGSIIYKKKCARCHGKNAEGSGPQAKSLKIKPTNFHNTSQMAEMNDGYLYWRVAEGGKQPPFNSKMPAFKDALTEKEVWQVLSYVHAFSHKHLLSHSHEKEKGDHKKAH